MSVSLSSISFATFPFMQLQWYSVITKYCFSHFAIFFLSFIIFFLVQYNIIIPNVDYDKSKLWYPFNHQDLEFINLFIRKSGYTGSWFIIDLLVIILCVFKFIVLNIVPFVLLIWFSFEWRYPDILFHYQQAATDDNEREGQQQRQKVQHYLTALEVLIRRYLSW